MCCMEDHLYVLQHKVGSRLAEFVGNGYVHGIVSLNVMPAEACSKDESFTIG